MRNPAVVAVLVVLGLVARAPGQDWTDDQLVEASKGFATDGVPERLAQIASLLQNETAARSAICARIHGDHREFMLKVDRHLAELTDARWTVREQAERTLIEVGARAKASIQQRAESAPLLEERMRCRRILDAIQARGDVEERKQVELLRGLVATAAYMKPDERLVRALRSALGHTDASVVEGAIRALAVFGGDDEANAVHELLEWKGGVHRTTVLSALFRMPSKRALELVRKLQADGKLSRAEQFALLHSVRGRADAAEALADLRRSTDELVAVAARVELPQPPPGAAATKASAELPERPPTTGTFEGTGCDAVLLSGAIENLPVARIHFTESDTIDFPDHALAASTATRVFTNQGTTITGTGLAIDAESVRLQSPLFGPLMLPRASVQGIATDPALDRLVGASVEQDRVRLRTNEWVEGTIQSVDANEVVLLAKDGATRKMPLATVAGMLTRRPRQQEPDPVSYVRFDTVDGDRVIGFLAGSSKTDFVVACPQLGAAVLPVAKVRHVEVGVGGGATWGFTLIADYSDNRVLEVDEQGRETFKIEDVFGAWDIECLDNNNLLITEFAVSRVQEVDRQGNVVWAYDDLKNPYDADRLPNGNTLIADAFSLRVIEVDRDKNIVWKYDQQIRPYDVDRLPNGNTLIADVLRDRVIEVSPAGEIVWEVKGMNNVHDADRLPNGNTLITLRSKGSVLEVDRDGSVVWELSGLVSPSDADRLPNGHTLVSENGTVREFDRKKQVVWRREVNWAVEANRY